MQFDTTINDWHTCPADGRIRASNPCSEYMFLDDTACNLASINLLKFRDERRALRHRGLRARRAGCGRSCSKSRC
jgi:ribonucleoside-diphosphate reductase alpha chain